MTMEFISKTTTSQSLATLTVSGISDKYSDLLAIIEFSSTTGYQSWAFRINGISTAQYNHGSFVSDGGSTSPTFYQNATDVYLGKFSANSSSPRAISTLYIPGYSLSGKPKLLQIENGSLQSSGSSMAIGSLFGESSSTSPVTSITVFNPDAGQQIAAGASVYLYGIGRK